MESGRDDHVEGARRARPARSSEGGRARPARSSEGGRARAARGAGRGGARAARSAEGGARSTGGAEARRTTDNGDESAAGRLKERSGGRPKVLWGRIVILVVVLTATFFLGRASAEPAPATGTRQTIDQGLSGPHTTAPHQLSWQRVVAEQRAASH